MRVFLLALIFGTTGSSATRFGGRTFPGKLSSKHCTDRGGCDCECDWAKTGCHGDDGSCCYACCCDAPPSPAPAPEHKPSPSAPAPTPGLTRYCPTEQDFTGSDNVVFQGNGWTMTGSGGVHGKTSFNLLGGYVEFDMDTTKSTAATNTNFYTTSPDTCCDYCDIQANKSPQCMEMDIIEANGNCAMATTWHTNPNHDGGCDEGGCQARSMLPGSQFHIKASFAENGVMTVTLNGELLNGYNPSPTGAEISIVAETMKTKGAMFHSTQWQGWVPSPPTGSCPTGGDLPSSKFSIHNVTIVGKVVQGETPTAC